MAKVAPTVPAISFPWASTALPAKETRRGTDVDDCIAGCCALTNAQSSRAANNLNSKTLANLMTSPLSIDFNFDRTLLAELDAARGKWRSRIDRLFCRALSSAQGPVEQCGDKPFSHFWDRLSRDPAISGHPLGRLPG
jgi:hypothetical protein